MTSDVDRVLSQAPGSGERASMYRVTAALGFADRFFRSSRITLARARLNGLAGVIHVSDRPHGRRYIESVAPLLLKGHLDAASTFVLACS